METFEFHPIVAKWFEEKFHSPTEPQQRGWPAIKSGKHTLIAAPTGTGKTLAAFFAALDELFCDGLAGRLEDEVRVVYVSPLKALSNDIHKNLEEPLEGLRAALKVSEGRDIVVRSATRTGDTPASERRAMLKRPPHILVTTPESLYLLLTSASGRKLLGTARTLIVDEIHALAGNRRGSHLSISMQRLAALVKHPLQRIGLSATQKPIEDVAKFLLGSPMPAPRGSLPRNSGNPECVIVDTGYRRELDLKIELPGSALEAVMSHEVWAEVYNQLAGLIDAHQTTLIFVNTRRLAERVAHHLCERLGADKVASHHGSLSARLRLDAENRLKRGQLKALVATASLELGIDIGSVDLVCQIGPTRSIATLLQRVGRAEHRRGGLPKGRLFPLSRDELVECAATIWSIRRGELDCLEIPEKPLDVLAQQIVACVATDNWDEKELFQLMRSAYPYRNLQVVEFRAVLQTLAEGFSTKRGRRAALVHHDAINHRIRARRGAGLIALTSGGAIPDNADYRVVLEPSETFIGTVNEDFAIESLAGDIFQLGNASWKILRVNSGQVRVEDAHGQPPNMPFWLGEAPGRTRELSRAVSDLRLELDRLLREKDGSDAELSALKSDSSGTKPGSPIENAKQWLKSTIDLSEAGAQQLTDYFAATERSLGVIPSQKNLVMERFFDESGGMQLVIHSPFGIRVNRAWGLALRKRFCRSFNFELQAAASDDAIVLSLGTTHSFPLDEVFRYLNSRSVREVLVQALLDAPMFGIRWRWNATRSLALPRQRGGRKIPAPLQRMESENLLSAVFPDQLACLENIVGDREVPDHPLVKQTIEDCLTEAMDIEGLIGVLRSIENNEVQCTAMDLPEPSPLAHEILNARPYAFLDDAPLEERRTHAVLTRRAGQSSAAGGLGILDASAIEKVVAEAWLQASNVDELHEALLLTGALTEEETARVTTNAVSWLKELVLEGRAGKLGKFWIAAERVPMLLTVYPNTRIEPALQPPESEAERVWERADAIRELVRGRMEVCGPITETALAELFELPENEIAGGMLALETEGFVLRGKFNPNATEVEWCDRRLLARIHRLTINRLRAEIQPVSIAEFQRFLTVWQRVAAEQKLEGPLGVSAAMDLLDGFGLPAAAWEPEILALRVKDYSPQWLDQLCFTGRLGWGRLSPRKTQNGRPSSPVRSSPISLFAREHSADWMRLAGELPLTEFTPDTRQVLQLLSEAGALFFGEIVNRSGILPSRVEQALADLCAEGLVTSDSFEGLRALITPLEKRIPYGKAEKRGRHKGITSLEFAGRWSLLRPMSERIDSKDVESRDKAIGTFAKVLLHRYGVIFRRLIERESMAVSWYELSRVYRRLEAQGEIRGGYFVGGVSGEQFALPEAIGLLRSIRALPARNELVVISGADPLNLAGILAPGRRVAAITANRVLLCDGVPIAALESGEISSLNGEFGAEAQKIERTLRIGEMAPGLLRYYG